MSRSIDSPVCKHGWSLFHPHRRPQCVETEEAIANEIANPINFDEEEQARADIAESYADYDKTPQGVTADGGGLRFDFGKNQLELIPPEWTWALGLVMSRGAIKYAVRNWERGMPWSKCVGCAFRHIFKFVCGERYDAETGCHHLGMAAWNLLALMSYDIRKIGENDLVGNPAWLEACAVAPGPALAKVIAEKEAEAKAARATA